MNLRDFETLATGKKLIVHSLTSQIPFEVTLEAAKRAVSIAQVVGAPFRIEMTQLTIRLDTPSGEEVTL